MTTWQIARAYGNDDVRNDDADVDGNDEERRSLEGRDTICKGGHSVLSDGLFHKLDGPLSWQLVERVNALYCSLKKKERDATDT